MRIKHIFKINISDYVDVTYINLMRNKRPTGLNGHLSTASPEMKEQVICNMYATYSLQGVQGIECLASGHIKILHSLHVYINNNPCLVLVCLG